MVEEEVEGEIQLQFFFELPFLMYNKRCRCNPLCFHPLSESTRRRHRRIALDGEARDRYQTSDWGSDDELDPERYVHIGGRQQGNIHLSLEPRDVDMVDINHNENRREERSPSERSIRDQSARGSEKVSWLLT